MWVTLGMNAGSYLFMPYKLYKCLLNGKCRLGSIKGTSLVYIFIYTKVWVYVWPTGVGVLAEEPFVEEELFEDQLADLYSEQVDG